MMYDRILAQYDTEYGEIAVTEIGNKRYLVCDGYMQSAIDLHDQDELVFPYMRTFSYAFAVNPDIRNTLLIGGGACSYPRYYLSHYEGQIRVIEINEKVIELAKQYFELDTLLNIYKERLSIVNDEAMSYLKRSEEKYDLIINDAFIGKKEEGVLKEDLTIMHEHLGEKGILLINCTSSLKGFSSWKYKKMMRLLKKEFSYVAVLQCEEEISQYRKQNILLISSNARLI